MAMQQQASERRLRAVSTHLRLPHVALHSSASRACAAASFSAFADSSDLHPLFRERPNLMLVPIATPLKPDGQSLDEPALRRYVDHLYACGYEGLYVGGSSGEGYHMEEALRQELTVAAVEASRGTGKIVCVHVGASRQSEALRLATHAVAAGADAIASIPPYVGSPAPTFNETLEFYRQLAEIANGIPVICYNIPGLTGVALSVGQLVQLLQIPGVEGIKFSDDNLPALSQLAARCPDKVIFNGLDALLSFGLMYGAHGGIGTTYNILPELYLQADKLVRSDQCAAAIAVQKRANAGNSGYKVVPGKQMQSVKQILIWQGLLESASMAQAQELTTAEVAALREAVEGTAEIAATLPR